MELELFLGGLILLTFIGSILGIVSTFRVNGLREKLDRFEQRVQVLSKQVQSLYESNMKLHSKLNELEDNKPAAEEDSPKSITLEPIEVATQDPIKAPSSELPSALEPTSFDAANSIATEIESHKPDQIIPPPFETKERNPQLEKTVLDEVGPKTANQNPQNPEPLGLVFFDKVKEHWMVWLGGLCIALAGIFLVKYSMEQGLLGPKARIAMGLVTGLALHIVAEWLRRAKGTHDSFAALAGGASITLFATFLAALHLYQIIPPGVVFVFLFIIAMATMVLALVHGPVLAGIGILGAYLVPILVNTGSNNVMGAMIYALIVTVSALFLIKYVYKDWLWVGTLVGALFWWLISLGSSDIQVQIVQPLYLAAIAYLVIAIHYSDWTLLAKWQASEKLKPWGYFKTDFQQHESRLLVLFVLLILGMALTVAMDSAAEYLLFNYFPFAAILMMICRHKPIYTLLPWLLFLTTCGAFFVSLDIDLVSSKLYGTVSPDDQNRFLLFIIFLALFYFIFGLWNLRVSAFKGTASSLPLLSPFVLISVGYLLLPGFTQGLTWGLISLFIGCCYMAIVIKNQNRDLNKMVKLALILSAHVGYSLAVVLMVEQATLTLALSAQVLSLAWLRKEYSIQHLDWAIRVLCAVILMRLSLNPFLLTYSNDIHWSLWTYGGSLLFCFFASRIIPPGQTIRAWLEGACLHLLVLLIATETRYWMYDGEIFVSEYSFTEATLNTLIWGTLALVYHWRSQLSNSLSILYKWASYIMLALTAGNFIFVVFLAKNPLWYLQDIGNWPIVNMLLLAYGAPIALVLAYAYYFPKQFRNYFLISAAALSFFFINLEIRHLWTPEIHYYQSMSNGELYTYSLVWLALAIVGVLSGTRYAMEKIYKGGMILLLAVVAKIFLIDMSGLEGLLRVVSFMGLGFSLLALAFMHQKIQKVPINN